MDNIMNSIMDVCESFVDIFASVFNVVAAVVDGVQCKSYTSLPYPEVTISSAGIPSLSMSSFEVCDDFSYDTSHVTDAMSDIGDAVMNSTLFSTLIDNAGLGSSGLIEHKTAEGRLKLGHEMNTESCDPAVGAFEIGFSGEGQFKVGAMAIGVSLVIGCHEDGHVTSDIRLNTGFGLATPSVEEGGASVTIAWGNSFPSGFDDEFTWAAGIGDFQAGVGTSGLTDWIDMADFEFKGVGVDIDAEKFGELTEKAATKLGEAADSVAGSVIRCISSVTAGASGLSETESSMETRALAATNDAVEAKSVSVSQTTANATAREQQAAFTHVYPGGTCEGEVCPSAGIGFSFSFCLSSFTEIDCNY